MFRDELLAVQEEYLRNTSVAEPEEDDDLDYSNDDLGENTEVTPLGDAVDEEDIDNAYINDVDPDEDEDDLLIGDDEDVDLDTDTDLDDDDEVVDQALPGDDDDDLGEDEDLTDDEDLYDDDDEFGDLETTEDVPDTEDDDLLTVDDDDDDLADEDGAPRFNSSGDFSSRHQERSSGRLIDHEPGIQGFDPSL
jgi:hypothetical protein